MASSHKVLHNAKSHDTKAFCLIKCQHAIYRFSLDLRSFLKRPAVSRPVFLVAASQLKSSRYRVNSSNNNNKTKIQFNNEVFVCVAIFFR